VKAQVIRIYLQTIEKFSQLAEILVDVKFVKENYINLEANAEKLQ
jgi:hypothetical protein